jgi:hypothetical protein
LSEDLLAGLGVELPWFLGMKKTAKQCREVMSKPVIKYDMHAELPDPSETDNPDLAGLFHCAQNDSEK